MANLSVNWTVCKQRLQVAFVAPARLVTSTVERQLSVLQLSFG